MYNIDIKEFFLTGHILGLQNGQKESEAIDIIGKVYEVEDYGIKGKYLHYDNIRLSFSDEKLDGITIFLINSAISYESTVSDETFDIDKNTSLLRVLHFLNLLGLKWEVCFEDSKLDYLQLQIIPSKVKLFFYYEKEQLERLSLYF